MEKKYITLEIGLQPPLATQNIQVTQDLCIGQVSRRQSER